MKKIIAFVLFIITMHVSAQEVKFGKVSEEELKEKFHPIDSTASAAYLYKHRITSYEYSERFIVVTKVHERIKIYNKEGLAYANKLITYYKPKTGNSEDISGIKGYTFNLEEGTISKEKLASKQVFEERISKYRRNKKIAMPAVKVGSVIDLKYEIRSPYDVYVNDVEFQFAIPVKSYVTKINIPEFYIFKKNIKGYYSITPKQGVSNKTITFISNGRSGYHDIGTPRRHTSSTLDYQTKNDVFIAKNIPALKDNEPYTGNVKNYRGGVSYELATLKFPNSILEHYSKTWGDVTKNIYKNSRFGIELNKTGYFKNELTAVLASLNTEEEKLIAVLQFVKSKVKWNKHYGKYTDLGVKKAYKEGVGNVADINLMLTAMLRHAGLKAEPVLVSSKNNGIPLFPSRRGFNYVVSIVEFEDGSQVVLDATEPLSIPNVLPERVLNWKGRQIKEDGSSAWVDLTSSQYSETDTKVYVKITEDNIVEGLQRSILSRNKALDYRLNKNTIEKLEGKYDMEIEDFKLSNINDLGKPVAETIKFTKDDLIEEISGKLYLAPLLHLGITENPFKSEVRKFPVDFTMPWRNKKLINITLPEGYKVEFVPAPLAIALPENIGVFKFNVTVKGNVVNIQSAVNFNKAMVSSKYYPELKDFYKQMVSKNLEKIILVKQ